MTGLVEMASIPLWKQNVRSSRNYDDFMEPGRKSNDKYNISDIPSMNQNYTVSNPSNRSRGGVSSAGTSVSNSSSPAINNIPRYNEGDGNKVQFDLGSDFDTQETEEMGVDINAQGSTCRQDIGGDRGLSNSYLAKGIDSSHLKHVQSNPFFKELGVQHTNVKVFNDSLPESPELSRSGSSSTVTEDEVDNNYSPHSGIVEKLRKKFSNLTNKDNLKPGKLRHYGSLDNLLERGSPQKRKPSETPKSTYHRSSVSSEQDVMSKSAVFEAEKQAVNHAVHSVPKPKYNDAVTKRNDSSSSVEEQRSPRPRIMSEEIKDIIIIEQPPKIATEVVSSRRSESKVSKNLKTKSMKDETEETELPKPNTVSNFRSLFEAGSSKGNNRKILPDAPRSPQFISAARPPLPRSKPPTVSKSSKPVAPQKTEESVKTEPSSSSSSIGEITDTSSSSSSVISSAPSASLSSTKTTSAAAVTSTPSSVSFVKTDVISQTNDNTRSHETQSEKVEPYRPPRAFESPVTKKKEFGETKSIFDSASIETTAVSKPKPKRVAPKVKAPPVPASPILQNSSFNSSNESLPDKNDSHVEKEKPSIVKTESIDNNDMHVVKVADAVKKAHDNAKNFGDTVKSKKQNNDGKKTLVFDSSSMIKSKNKPDNLINPDKPRAPPRPKATAKKLRSNSFDGEDEKQNDTSKDEFPETTTEETIVTITVNKTPAATEEKTVVSDNKSADRSMGNKKSESISVVTPRGLSSPLITSTPTESESVKPVSRFAPVSASEMDTFKNSIENDGTPTRGIPSIIANRLKPKDNSSTDNVPKLKIEEDDKVDDSSNNIVLPSQLKSKNLLSNGVISSPVPKKRQSNNADKTETVLDLTKTSAKNNEVQRTNIDDLIKGKHSSPVSVFDSSNIPAKKKPSSSPAANGVPPLDLSLIEEKKNHPYQEGYIPTKIEPCKIVFIGAGVSFNRKPLVKTRTKKMKIQFNETATAHEYQSESAALHDYLVIHPKEEEEARQEEKVLQLEDFEFADQESSDDVPETPRSNGTDSSLSSGISHLPGDFGGYKSKMSMDFQFGMDMQEEEPVKVEEPEPNTNSEDMDFLPAAEDDTHNWTDTSIPDMLF